MIIPKVDSILFVFQKDKHYKKFHIKPADCLQATHKLSSCTATRWQVGVEKAYSERFRREQGLPLGLAVF